MERKGTDFKEMLDNIIDLVPKSKRFQIIGEMNELYLFFEQEYDKLKEKTDGR